MLYFIGQERDLPLKRLKRLRARQSLLQQLPHFGGLPLQIGKSHMVKDCSLHIRDLARQMPHLLFKCRDMPARISFAHHLAQLGRQIIDRT